MKNFNVTTERPINLFIRFMKKENSYYTFVRNMLEYHTSAIDMEHYLWSMNPLEYLQFAFDWRTTKGEWSDLNEKWRRIYRSDYKGRSHDLMKEEITQKDPVLQELDLVENEPVKKESMFYDPVEYSGKSIFI